MNKVTARAITTQYSFSSETLVTRIEYNPGNLVIYLRGLSDEASLIVEFNHIVGFRVLDEGYLPEYWPECSTPNGWLFEITSGGWLSPENDCASGIVVFMNPGAKEYLVTGANECVSVLSDSAPLVRENAL